MRKHAAAGVARAQFSLGMHLLSVGSDDNVRSGLDLLVAAARQGHAPALHTLGMLHRLGRGPDLDLAAALPLSVRAAELGDPDAMAHVATRLIDAVDGEHAARGLAFFTALAENGSEEAAKIVILRLLVGRTVSPDFSTAAYWLRRSESAWAMLWLAALHAKGVGVELDPERARALEENALESATVQERVDFALQLAFAAPDVRDGGWALRVLDAALADPNNRSPMNLTSLAEVYASLGRFADAIGAQEEALAELGYAPDLERVYRARYEQLLARYRRFAEAAEAAGAPR